MAEKSCFGTPGRQQSPAPFSARDPEPQGARSARVGCCTQQARSLGTRQPATQQQQHTNGTLRVQAWPQIVIHTYREENLMEW